MHCPKCLEKSQNDEDASGIDDLITLRPHVIGLKSALLVSAVLKSPTQAAQDVQGIDKEKSDCIAGGLRSHGSTSCRCKRSDDRSISSLDAAVQELRTTIRMVDKVLANVVDEVKGFKNNANELNSDADNLRISLTAVREKQKGMEKIITSSRLSSRCFYR